MKVIELANFSDDRGNCIQYDGPVLTNVQVTFRGSNNTMVVAPNAKLGRLSVTFDCDNGNFSIGGNAGAPAFSANVRVGQDSTVAIGSNVSTTAICGISATEGTTVSIGDDVMFASNNQIRADDGHAIYDVQTDKRVNVSRSISIGNHVWVGYNVAILGGVSVGDGSVLGFGAILTKDIPNNCVAAGVPARVIRRHIAWERPHLSLSKPFYKPDASDIKKSPYWNLTVDPAAADNVVPSRWLVRRMATRVRRKMNQLKGRVQGK